MKEVVLSLVDRYGLDLKREHIERVIREIEALGVDDPKIAEKIAISELDIGESYFFRDSDTWKVIEKIVVEKGSVRALSLGCSEGEEVYTLSFVLKDIGVGSSILGIDACEERIERAKDGIYGERKLRKIPTERRSRYFENLGGLYRVRESYRIGVRFSVGNIADHIPPGLNDLILIRRVLIYFDRDTMRRVLKNLKARLSDGGYLILGKGEVYEELLEEYEPVPFPGVVFWKKRERVMEKDDMEIAVEPQTIGISELLKRFLNAGKYEKVYEITEEMMKAGFKEKEVILYNLLALVYSGEDERARERMKVAMRDFPNDPDLMRLGKVIN